jgi:hypothetical protein
LFGKLTDVPTRIDRRYLRGELLVDLVDQAFAWARRQPQTAVARHGNHDGVGDGAPLLVDDACGDLRGLRQGSGRRERQDCEQRGDAHETAFRQ